MKVKQLGTVIFEMNEMYINEDFVPANVIGKSGLSTAGTHIVFEASIETPYITLNSANDSWITEAQKDTLTNMWEQLATEFTLTYSDDSTDQVRMAKEKSLIFTPLSEGYCDHYQALIPLAKV